MQWETEKKSKTNDEEGSSAKTTVKQTIESTQEDLAGRFQTHLTKFKRHVLNTCQQYVYNCGLLSNMANDECLIHVDFSCKYGTEIHSVHFESSHKQATFHTGVMYVGENQEKTCFTSISPSKYKTLAAIWEYLRPALDHLQTSHPEVPATFFSFSCSVKMLSWH